MHFSAPKKPHLHRSEYYRLNVARVLLMHNHIRNTRIHLAEKNMDTISPAQGNMSALLYGHGNMSRNTDLFN